jgi:osmotically-inducible protein OsmY
MKHIRPVIIAIALSCAIGTAWADSPNRSVNAAGKDGSIRKQLATQLLQETAVGPYGIQVRTQNGFVRLSGSVGTVRDWKKADELARGSEGVAEVQNDLSVLIR